MKNDIHGNKETPNGQINHEKLITRLQIVPGNLTSLLNEKVFFTTVAYDVPVGGIDVTWHAHNERDQEIPISILQHGEFLARLPGIFKVTAEVGNYA